SLRPAALAGSTSEWLRNSTAASGSEGLPADSLYSRAMPNTVFPLRAVIAALCLSVLALTGCAHHKPAQSSPQKLYTDAKHDLDSYNYNTAIKKYEQLTAVYPFTEQAHQAQLDLIYAYYRAGETDSAIDACDTF